MNADSRLRGLAVVIGVLALYLALALPIIDRQGINWDEQTDLEIAESYFVSLDTALTGSKADLVNVRLPMFSVAALQLLGASLDLRTARLASVLVGALTLLGVFAFARIELDERRGLVAMLLLAVNPLFLSYSTLAFTEGDVFIACFSAWTLAAFAWLWQSPTRLRGALAGLALGLALSSKFSALAFIPAMTLATGLRDERRPGPSDLMREARSWLIVGLALGAWILLQAIATHSILPDLRASLPETIRASSTRGLLILAFLIVLVTWSLRRPSACLDYGSRLVYPLLVAVAVFFVVPPVHTTNGSIFWSLWHGSLHAGGGFEPGLAAEIGLLHLAVLAIKPSIGIGVAMLVGFVLALVRWRERPELRAPFILVAAYGLFLLTLPWGQVRYTMPLIPPLALLAADALVTCTEKRPPIRATVAAAIATLCAVDLLLCYPDVNLNGYQWFGTQYWGGRSTLGYRSLGQVGSDGLEQATVWVAAQADEADSIVTYSAALHIVARARPHSSRALWIDGVRDRDALLEADWVITHLNGDIEPGHGSDDPEGEVFAYPLYDRAYLIENFAKAYTVERRLGVVTAAVWRRIQG